MGGGTTYMYICYRISGERGEENPNLAQLFGPPEGDLAQAQADLDALGEALLVLRCYSHMQ